MSTLIKRLANLSMMLLLIIIDVNYHRLYAADKDNNAHNPIGCKNVGYEFNLKTLHLLPSQQGTNQALFFIYNSFKQPVTLYQMRHDDSAHSIYMNHAIGANQWAVLSTTERNKRYICTVADANSMYGNIVDCAYYLRVCEYTNVKYGMNNRGNFWLVNSDSRNVAVNQVVHYGIIPGV
jgi:hypothetical protein